MLTRGWKLFIDKGATAQQMHHAVSSYVHEYDRDINKLYLYRKEIFERIAPGQKRRADYKESERRANREQIREIVSGIFAKNKVRKPSTNLHELGWIKKKR